MSILIAGCIGGMVGGMAIAALGMSYGAATSRGLWALPNRIGGLLLGPRPVGQEVFGTSTVMGVLLHLLLSAAYGIAIVLIARNLTHNYAVTGLAVGVAIWIVNYYGVGAIHAASRQIAQLNPAPVALALHALYGIIAGLLGQALI